jgi:hypothetical protein
MMMIDEHSSGEHDTKLEITEAEISRLLQLETACKTIWPAIRYFGVCGADPRYTVAAMEIGQLIGAIPREQSGPQVDAVELAAMAKLEARDEIANWIGSAIEVRKHSGIKLAGEIAAEVRKLQLS